MGKEDYRTELVLLKKGGAGQPNKYPKNSNKKLQLNNQWKPNETTSTAQAHRPNPNVCTQTVFEFSGLAFAYFLILALVRCNVAWFSIVFRVDVLVSLVLLSPSQCRYTIDAFR